MEKEKTSQTEIHERNGSSSNNRSAILSKEDQSRIRRGLTRDLEFERSIHSDSNERMK